MGVIVKPTITASMHTVLMGVLDMIMNCSRNKPVDAVTRQRDTEQQRIQKFYSLSLRIRIKLQQLRRLTMSETFLDEKRLFAWMRRSWTSSGLNM